MTTPPSCLPQKILAGLLVFAAACILIGVRLHTYHEPLERDITTYAVVGHELLHGGKLYTDLWDHKPPAVHVTFALGEVVAGYGPSTIFLLGSLAGLATLAGLFCAVLWAGGGAEAGGIAALLWALPGSDLFLQANQPNTEVFINAFLVWGVALSIRIGKSGPSWKSSLIAAICWALASLYKMVAVTVPALVVPLTAYGLYRRRVGGRAVAEYGLTQLLTGVVIWLLVSGYFLVLNRFQDFYDVVFVFNRSYAKSLFQAFSLLGQPNEWLPDERSLIFGLSMTAVVGIVLLVMGRKWTSLFMLVAYLLGSSVAVILPGNYYPHYFQLLVPPLVLCAALGLTPTTGTTYLSKTLKCCFLGVALALLFWQAAGQWRLSAEEWSRVKYDDLFITSARLGRWLGDHTPKDRTIYEFGAETGLYFYSQRRPAVGIFYNYPIFMGPLHKKYAARVISEVITKKPDTIILNEKYWEMLLSGNWQYWQASQWKALFAFLNENYQVVKLDKDSFPLAVLKKLK